MNSFPKGRALPHIRRQSRSEMEALITSGPLAPGFRKDKSLMLLVFLSHNSNMT
jgi:hypothetical protein